MTQTAPSALNAAMVRDLVSAPSGAAFSIASYSPQDRAQLDESQLVFELMRKAASKSVMVDVGAHHGRSLARFSASGWSVYAFEPDPANYLKLTLRCEALPNVSIFNEAVSEFSAQDVPFYASEESSEIGSLSAFRSSHREIARVKTIRLSDFIARHNLTAIDFLKVDVEGFEMAVLRGLDFSKLSPSVVLTGYRGEAQRFGSNAHDLGRFFIDRGYSVYLSEWHSLESYGGGHCFHNYCRYPAEVSPDSWGSVLAFKEDPERRALKAAIRSSVNLPVRFNDEQGFGASEVLELVRKLETEAGARKRPALHAFETSLFEREARAQMDECRLIFKAVQENIPQGVMIDVGAHFGSSLRDFAEAGWVVYAFEPDPANRAKLLSAHGKRSNVTMSDEAVSDRAGVEVPFYASSESTGISGLSAFRETHREVARVKTTTLNDVVARHGITRIDFLKIDVEGFEMAVLRGLDFDKMKPDVVLAEYEDDKTKAQGYDVHDLCKFLTGHGYAVYVSEWHPIERYGTKHSFRRFVRYPYDIPATSWGNLIAFKVDPDLGRLKAAIRAAVDKPVSFLDEPMLPPVSKEGPAAVPAPAASSARPPTSTAAAAPPPTVPVQTARTRAILLGNGPSLKGFDFHRLTGLDTFGMNAAYRHWDKIGWYPTHYSCLDTVLGLSHEENIGRLIKNRENYGIRKFLLRRNLIERLGKVAENNSVVDFDRMCESSKRYAREPITTGSHTLIWAADLGFREIVLLGVDVNYVEIVPGAIRGTGIELKIVSTERNPNYFFDDYQRVGDRYQIPNASPNCHLLSWRVAADVASDLGAVVLNANEHSQVDAFDFCAVDDIFKSAPIPQMPRTVVFAKRKAHLDSKVAVSTTAAVAASIPYSPPVASGPFSPRWPIAVGILGAALLIGSVAAAALSLPGGQLRPGLLYTLVLVAAAGLLTSLVSVGILLRRRDLRRRGGKIGSMRASLFTISDRNSKGPLRKIAASGLFNGQWYLAQNPDVAQAKADPLLHYVKHGASEGRLPCPYFDPHWYLTKNPDVARSAVEPLSHYLTHGWRENRDPIPLFNTAWYLLENPDVVASGVEPLTHYMRTGWREGRNPCPLFKSTWYLAQNPDVHRAGLEPLAHYLSAGWREGRSPNPLFKPLWYTEQNPDVAQAGVEPLAHFISSGWQEGRSPHPDFPRALAELGLNAKRKLSWNEIEAVFAFMSKNSDALQSVLWPTRDGYDGLAAKVAEAEKRLAEIAVAGNATSARIEERARGMHHALAAKVANAEKRLAEIAAVDKATSKRIEERASALQQELAAKMAEAEKRIAETVAADKRLQQELAAKMAAADKRIAEVAAAGKIASDRIEANTGKLQQEVAAKIAAADKRIAEVAVAGKSLAERIESLTAKSQADHQSLAASLQGSVTNLGHRLETSLSEVAQRAAELRDDLAEKTQVNEKRIQEVGGQVNDGLNSLKTLVDAGRAEQAKLQATATAAEARALATATSLSRMNASNAAAARPHTRLLDGPSMERIFNHWLPTLGISMKKSAIAYFAHRMCLAEDQCDGRFATTIQAMILRLLAMRSLGPAPQLNVLEIGTLFGLGSAFFHMFRGPDIGRVKLTIIDPLSGYYSEGQLDMITGVPITLQTLQSNLARLNIPAEDVRILQGQSQDQAIRRQAASSRYDLILIDGDHSREGVRRDYEMYAPLLEPGGIILFDDYDTPEWPEIKDTVDRIMANATGLKWIGNEWRTGIAKSTAERRELRLPPERAESTRKPKRGQKNRTAR